MKHPKEPTPDQCSKGERVEDWEGQQAYACWYPQMGGYVGKCVVTFSPEKDTYDYCFEAFVWHNGDFPFGDTNEFNEPQAPVSIHHCMPSQFVAFGNFVQKKQQETK
jgi:hypothetical protein